MTAGELYDAYLHVGSPEPLGTSLPGPDRRGNLLDSPDSGVGSLRFLYGVDECSLLTWRQTSEEVRSIWV